MIFETLEQKRAKAKKIKLEAERLLSENKKLVEEIKTQEVEEERKRNRYEKFREMFGISIVSDNLIFTQKKNLVTLKADLLTIKVKMMKNSLKNFVKSMQYS